LFGTVLGLSQNFVWFELPGPSTPPWVGLGVAAPALGILCIGPSLKLGKVSKRSGLVTMDASP